MPKLVVIFIFAVLAAGIIGGGVVLTMRQLGSSTETAGETGPVPKESKGTPGQLQPAEQTGNKMPGQKSGQDSDEDGLTDEDESIWGTDPNNSDTDGDGYLDGEEVKANHDPLKAAPNDLLGQAQAATPGGQPAAARPGLTVKALESYFADGLDITGGDKNYTEEYNSRYDEASRSPASMRQYAQAQPIITKLLRPSKNIGVEETETSIASIEKYLLVADNPRVLANANLYHQAQLDLQTSGNVSTILSLASLVGQYREQIGEISVPKEAAVVQSLLLGYTELLVATFNQIAQWNEDPVRSMVATRQLESIDRIYYPIIYSEFERLRFLQQNLSQAGG